MTECHLKVTLVIHFVKFGSIFVTGKQIGKYHRLQTKHNPKSDGIGNSFFLADRTNGRAYATVLRLSVCL